MATPVDRNNYDGVWFAAGAPRPAYTKFQHRPVVEACRRDRIKVHFTEALVDHHVTPATLSGALARRGYAKTKTMLLERLPKDQRTRTGNLGEVLASEHLRQRYGYDMPVFKLRYMDNPQMAMRGEDLVAFRLDRRGRINALCVGESKAMQAFDAREVKDAHQRLGTAYHPHPVSLLMIASILHDKGSPLAEQVDVIVETLGTKPVPRDNWIFIITANNPRDPFSDIESEVGMVENLSCVDVVLSDLADFVQEVFDQPLRRTR